MSHHNHGICGHCGHHHSQCSCHHGHHGHHNMCKTVAIPAEGVKSVNHGDVIVLGNSSAVLVLDRPFQIPNPDSKGTISVVGEVASPPQGSLIYLSKDNQSVRLEVIGTTRFTEQLKSTACVSGCENGCGECNSQIHRTEFEVINQDLSCNTLAPGTQIEQCATALIIAPDCGVTGSGSSDLVLCDILHIPEIGETEVVQVSPSTSGLSIGDILLITDKKFQVFAIPDATNVELKNLGEGGPPGTSIDGSDCLSIKIFIIAGDNPCEKTPVTIADLLRVCEDGNDTVLDADDGQFIKKENGKFQGVNIVLPEEISTTFQGCLVLNDALSPQEYAILVDDVTDFQVNDVVTFSCDDQKREFRLTDITANVFTLVPEPSVIIPPGLTPIAENCEGCKIVSGDCCRRLEGLINPVTFEDFGVDGNAPAPNTQIPNADTFDNDPANQIWADNVGGIVAGVQNIPTIPNFTINNTLSCDVLVRLRASLAWTITKASKNCGLDPQVLLSFDAFAGIDFTQPVPPGVAILGLKSYRNTFMNSVNTFEQDGLVHILKSTIAPGDSLTIHVLGRILNRLVGDTPSEFNNIPVGLEVGIYPQCSA